VSGVVCGTCNTERRVGNRVRYAGSCASCVAWLQDEQVEHPAHYTAGGVETIDAIEAWGLGFCLGNAVKYISRAGKKDPSKTLEDLRKARWYLDREISRRELGSET
jgi:hypothetical protein